MVPFWITIAAACILVVALVVLGRAIYWAIKSKVPSEQNRPWRAHSPSGSVPLGICGYSEALARASKLGKVSFVDEPRGFIFYDTHLGPTVSTDAQQNSGQIRE